MSPLRGCGTVRANGKKFDVPLAHVWGFKEGRAVKFMPFIDNPTMLAVLGASAA
jgi:ketosteroid isomerase-like protein